MSILGNLFGFGVPAWARPISASDYKKFQADVTEVFARRSIEVTFEWNLGGASCEDGRKFGFHNLVRTWCDTEPTERQGAIDSFLSIIDKNLDASGADLDSRLEALRLRLYDDEAMPPGSHLTMLPVGEHLFAALVIDEDDSLASVPPASVEASKHSVEELLEIARQNTWKSTTPIISRHETADGVITFVEAEYFGAALITSLDKLTEAGETYLVAAPARDMLILSKVSNYDADVLMRFLSLASKISSEFPRQYILPFVLEYKDGKLRDLCDRVPDALVLKDNIW
ncbi:MAG TPA: hypothetical protein VK171_01435 [Fimbriimonas sp.]|nr:hypothetical protein [Fimbriimonas sp.]